MAKRKKRANTKRAVTKSLGKNPSHRKKSLPPPEDSGRKQFLIAIISIVAVAILALLLVFSQQFVGKAIQQPFTGASNSAGAELVAPANPMQSFSLKIRANTVTEVSSVGFEMSLPPSMTCADVDS